MQEQQHWLETADEATQQAYCEQHWHSNFIDALARVRGVVGLHGEAAMLQLENWHLLEFMATFAPPECEATARVWLQDARRSAGAEWLSIGDHSGDFDYANEASRQDLVFIGNWARACWLAPRWGAEVIH